jgi:hypothetical protein
VSDEHDEWTERLARLFREHPAWIEAAARLAPESTSTVYFVHRPGEAWRLEQRRRGASLLRGGAAEPDLVMRFPPAAIERLEAVRGGVGDFAVELFELMTEPDEASHVDLRIAAGFGRLLSRGYVGLLRAAGPSVIAFGAARGVRTLGALRRLVSELSSRTPAPWESDAAD